MPRIKVDENVPVLCEGCKKVNLKLMKYKGKWICEKCLYPDDVGIDRSKYESVQSHSGFVI